MTRQSVLDRLRLELESTWPGEQADEPATLVDLCELTDAIDEVLDACFDAIEQAAET